MGKLMGKCNCPGWGLLSVVGQDTLLVIVQPGDNLPGVSVVQDRACVRGKEPRFPLDLDHPNGIGAEVERIAAVHLLPRSQCS